MSNGRQIGIRLPEISFLYFAGTISGNQHCDKNVERFIGLSTSFTAREVLEGKTTKRGFYYKNTKGSGEFSKRLFFWKILRVTRKDRSLGP